jgi:hypothetical protein
MRFFYTKQTDKIEIVIPCDQNHYNGSNIMQHHNRFALFTEPNDRDPADEPADRDDPTPVDLSMLPVDLIRKSYSELVTKYRDQFDKNLMVRLWNSWLLDQKFPQHYNTKLAYIRKFVLNVDQNELIVCDKPNRCRFEFHQICNALRLEHQSVDSDNPHDHNGSKTLIITKPKNWNWEQTVVSKEQKALNDSKLKEIVQKHKEFVQLMRTKRCIYCNICAVDTELFVSDKTDGLMCVKCIPKNNLPNHQIRHAYGYAS